MEYQAMKCSQMTALLATLVLEVILVGVPQNRHPAAPRLARYSDPKALALAGYGYWSGHLWAQARRC